MLLGTFPTGLAPMETLGPMNPTCVKCGYGQTYFHESRFVLQKGKDRCEATWRPMGAQTLYGNQSVIVLGIRKPGPFKG